MSGGIFQPVVDELDIGEFRRNPLLCYLCNELYDEPCLLSCYHSFCAQCLRGRATEGSTVCPLCGHVTEVSDQVPPPDALLKFLVESSVEEQVLCANCDQADSGMFFCNTCNQPLCVSCRDETHKAKMFLKHDIVKMSKRTKDIHRKCTLHGEPYIMFCKKKKTMLCINCFRDTGPEMRSNCIDLDSAYNQCCKKLDQAVQQIRQLQTSVHDGIFELRHILEELTKNCISEKEAINDLFINMLEKITQKKNYLLQDVDRQYQEREYILKEQLTTLNSLLPTLHTNLVTCTVFSSSANKYEFLDLAYMLINRLQNIAKVAHPIHPSQGSSFHTDFKHEYARCLETLIPFRSVSFPKDVSYAAKSHCGNHSNSGKRLEGSPVPSIGNYGYTNGFRRNGTSKVMFVEARGAFAEHCKEVDSKYKEIMLRFDKLKSRVQELQRDLTLRRCLTRKDNVDSITKESEKFGTELSTHLETLEQKRPLLEKHWEETCQMISDEQEIYQAQLNDTMRLTLENEHVITIAKQLEPFIKTIADVSQRLAPKLSPSKRESTDVLSALLEQINTMQPDSQHRVEAIQAAHEDRETINAKKTNPLDDALIKTKGMLKAAHRDSEGNRLSDPWLDHTVDGLPLGRVLENCDPGQNGQAGASKTTSIDCDSGGDSDCSENSLSEITNGADKKFDQMERVGNEKPIDYANGGEMISKSHSELDTETNNIVKTAECAQNGDLKSKTQTEMCENISTSTHNAAVETPSVCIKKRNECVKNGDLVSKLQTETLCEKSGYSMFSTNAATEVETPCVGNDKLVECVKNGDLISKPKSETASDYSLFSTNVLNAAAVTPCAKNDNPVLEISDEECVDKKCELPTSSVCSSCSELDTSSVASSDVSHEE